MKGLLGKAVLLTSACLFAATLSFATSSSKTTKTSANGWTCKTNASSAPSGSAGEKADNTMQNNPKSATAAFSYAFKNCRDCTEITCDVKKS